MLDTNYHFGDVYVLNPQIEASAESVKFHEVWKNNNGGVVLLAFKAGQELTTHTAPADVMVNVLEGEIEFTMNGHQSTILDGEFLLMGANVPHSVKAVKDSKVMLVKIKE